MTTATLESVSPGAPDPELLVAGMQRAAAQRLGAALALALQRADDYLFDSSNRGGEDTELTALRDLRRARAQIERWFEQSLVNGFHRLFNPGPMGAAAKGELSLLSDDGLEEHLACEQFVESLARRHEPALELLDQRLAALALKPALAAGDNPTGPAFLAETMRNALQGVELSTGTRIVLYKLLERELSPALADLYDHLNASLATAGILPRLLPSTPVIALPQPAQAAASSTASAAMAPGVAPEYAMSGPGDQALFSSLIGLLQSWRRSAAPARQEQAAATGRKLGVSEVMSVLSLLQTKPPQSLDQALSDNRVSLAEQLRREVLAGARRLGIGGDSLDLSSMEEDAFDLVGMLFDVLLDERHFEPDARRKIGRMVVPYVKVAVKDRRLFLHKGHPARRLLNAVAEACEGSQGEGTQDRELLGRVDTTIERLVAEFNEDLAIFETLEQELRAFMDQQRKRIELSERRAAEALSGRDRLEQARQLAADDLARRRGTRLLPPVLHDFATGYARHHLTQLILRDGRESARYLESLRAFEGLMVALDHAELGTPPDRLPDLERGPLLAFFASSGCVGSTAEDALAAIQRALTQLAAGDNSAANAARLPEQAVVSAPPPAEPVLALVAGTATLDFDPAVAERMRSLEIGTWLQVTTVTDRVELAKVSWISPISSRFLFVNRRGTRVLVASAEELAAMAKLGKVHLREADTAFEDAMHQVMGRLKSGIQPA